MISVGIKEIAMQSKLEELAIKNKSLDKTSQARRSTIRAEYTKGNQVG